ncbi:MAG TPA: stomatin-like protein, partial [Spirochaetota bacterium]|nr:stomatin-like protein [Spirochaetota bacterium]
MSFIAFFLITLAALFIIILASGIRIVQQSTVKIIERFGKYHRTLQTGINVIVPIIDKIRTVNTRITRYDYQGRTIVTSVMMSHIDLRERVFDFPKQNVITKDNVTLEIDALLYYQITDPFKSVYEVENLPMAIEKLTQTTLRNNIGMLELDQTLSSRDTINSKLRLILDEATDKWGVKVNRVELKDITPPKEIREAMEKQMRAERERRQVILLAEGEKTSKILQAE